MSKKALPAAALGFLGFCVVGGSADGRIIMPSGFFLAPDLTSEAIAPNPAKDILVTNVAVNDLPLPFARHFERSETVPIFDTNSQDRISWPLLVTLTGRHGRQCAGLGKPHEKTLHNPKAAANIAQRYVDVPFLRVAFDGLGECRNDARALKIMESALGNLDRSISGSPQQDRHHQLTQCERFICAFSGVPKLTSECLDKPVERPAVRSMALRPGARRVWREASSEHWLSGYRRRRSPGGGLLTPWGQPTDASSDPARSRRGQRSLS